MLRLLFDDFRADFATMVRRATAHLPYRAHYGPALRERVRTACALVDRFGYGF
jgi:hypothetical protein